MIGGHFLQVLLRQQALEKSMTHAQANSLGNDRSFFLAELESDTAIDEPSARIAVRQVVAADEVIRR
jgi:hypothetical protein